MFNLFFIGIFSSIVLLMSNVTTNEVLQHEKNKPNSADENESLENLKIHKAYIDELLSEIMLESKKISSDANLIQNELEKASREQETLQEKNVVNYGDPEKIIPRLHGFLMLNPEKPVKAPSVTVPSVKPILEENHDDTKDEEFVNVFELLNIFLRKLHESCAMRPNDSNEKLLSVLTRLKRFINNAAVAHD